MAERVFLPKTTSAKISAELLKRKTGVRPLSGQLARRRRLPWVAGGLRVKKKGLYAFLGNLPGQQGKVR